MLSKFGKALAVLAFSFGAVTAQAQEKVRIAHSTESFAFIPFLAAKSMGYFEKEGLDVEVIRTGSGSKTVAAVVGGSADVAIGSSSSILFARKQGVDLVMFAGLLNQYTSVLGYSKDWAEKHAVTEASAMKDKLAAMRGSRIGTTGPGGGDNIIRFIAELAGLNPDKDLTIVHLGNDIRVYLTALEQKRIDGFALSEPLPHIARREQGAVIAFNTAVGEVKELDGFLYIIAHARQEWLDKNPEAARKVSQGFQDALEAIRDPARTGQVRDSVRAAYYQDTDVDLFNEIWASFAKSVPATTEITADELVRVADFSNRFEENKIEAETLKGAFTNAFAKGR